MNSTRDFHGPNLAYALELYERFQEDPQSVDSATREFFESWSPVDIKPDSRAISPGLPAERIIAASNLAQSIRAYGHLNAQLDPLGGTRPGDPWLELGFYSLTEDDLRELPPEVVGGPIAEEAGNALEAIRSLRKVYEGRIGYSYGHIRDPDEREWLRYAAECGEFRPPDAPINPRELLERITRVEAFEQFLHRIFPGKTRFSIEGLDMLVPMLDELVNSAAEEDICSIVLGMAHRGRLNVLTHVLGKPYAQILAEFKDPGSNFTTRNELGWTGDVKYHKGARRDVESGETVKIAISMVPNPSHVEHVNPVVIGMARAAGSKVDRPGPPEFFPNAALSVLIHGDAAFPGQGIVSETLNLSRLPGYRVGGTIHLIANNQLGYTTTPEEGRSTRYASDLAKGFQIPIIHVNADAPEACLEAMRTAFAYRQKFGKDFLIDLVGYRRYGHNEGDEPSFTQPLMYKTIEEHPSVRQIWAQELIERGEIEEQLPDQLVQERMTAFQNTLEGLQPEEEIFEPQLEPPPPGEARRVQTAISLDLLGELNAALLIVPDDFNLHPKMKRFMDRRREIFEAPEKTSIDWATAEELAFASILNDGIPIRITGEDVRRGTFNQRHAVFYDFENGHTYIPLQSIPQVKAAMEVNNSPLTENAAVGFEYGYNIQSPKVLILWEAQYGDFINSAQPMIDEFLVSARAKWEQTPSLVLLLPHGYEGQGPDHSSGRLERFLQLAAQMNLRIANCTTAAQYFHLMRRQALLLKTDPLPLIVMTPKSLLRHPRVASSPKELAEGAWQPVIDDPRAHQNPGEIHRLILCSGKIYVDLVTADSYEESANIAIVRLEQLYPFPESELESVFNQYGGISEVVWLQEEPRNMGAWTFARPRLEKLIDGRWPLHYIGRIANGSPAEGSASWHAINQEAILQQAYDLKAFGKEQKVLEEGGIVERD